MSSENCNQFDIATIIIGGGLAGLTAANRLAEAERPFVLLEATDRVGGRVRTDRDGGFQLDHGFQVLLTAYPTCRHWLDYEALELCAFEPGALTRSGGHFRLLSDPWRRPRRAFSTLLHPAGSIADKWRIAKLRYRACQGSLDDLYQRPDEPTIDRLLADGFTQKFIDQFFRPFLGGVFLDESLQTSSRMLEFVFRMFASGDIAVPADGMAAIPRQLAERLPRGAIRFRATVDSIEALSDSDSESDTSAEGASGGDWLPRYQVCLSDGTRWRCQDVIVATPGDTAARLLDQPNLAVPWKGTTNLYYSRPETAEKNRHLMLRGDEAGPIQSAVFLSDVAPRYAPSRQSLVSVSVDTAGMSEEAPDELDDEALDRLVRGQLQRWFGSAVEQWQLLRTFHVPYGLPSGDLKTVIRDPHFREGPMGQRGGCYLAGDFFETPSIEGAMNSGQRAAEAILSGK